LIENGQGNRVPVGGGAFNEVRSKDAKATMRGAYNMNVTQNESRNDRGFPRSMDKRPIQQQTQATTTTTDGCEIIFTAKYNYYNSSKI